MRLIGYVRVSRVGGREGESFQSPDQQRKAIEAVARLKGAELVDLITDLDESGGTMDRPGAQEAIARVEAGEVDGVAVAYLDRWARNLEALQMIERWAKNGKVFVSASDQFDATTAAGKLTLSVLLSIAKFQRNALSARWDLSCQYAIERGVHVAVPYGYRRSNGRGSRLEIDVEQAVVVKRIFDEWLGGHGVARIARELNRDGIRSPKGGLWTRGTVRSLLKERAYTGEAARAEHVLKGAHPAIVTEDGWQHAQAKRAPSRSERSTALLAGVARCAGCGYVLTPSSSPHGGRRYSCRKDQGELSCPSPTSATAVQLDALVEHAFLKHFAPDAGLDPVDAEFAAFGEALEKARTEFATWRDDTEMRELIGAQDYRAGLVARKHAMDEADHAYQEAMRQSRVNALQVDEAEWEQYTVEERRELLRAALDAVVVTRAGSPHTPLRDRVDLIWAGELQSDGTRSGIARAVRGRTP